MSKKVKCCSVTDNCYSETSVIEIAKERRVLYEFKIRDGNRLLC